MLRGKKLLALLLALLLGAGLVSCGQGQRPAEPAAETGGTTIGEEPLPALANGPDGETEPAAPVEDTAAEAGASAQETEPETETTAKAEETTTAAAAKMPSGKAEIIAYVNGVMAQVRQDKPGCSFQERTIIDDTRISSASRLVDTLAPPVIRAAKSQWSSWSDPSTKAPGADHNDVIPKADLQSGWVKSASCTESGGNYRIRVNLADEHVPELPADGKSTMHGKVASVYTKSEVEDGAGRVGVKIPKFDCLYSGSYIDLTADKATGSVLKITAYISRQVDIEVKLGLTLSASLPIAMERVYTF